MKIRTLSPISLLTATAAILAIGAIPVAHAANIWDGGGADANWNTANNWDDNVVPVSPQNLTFSGDVQTSTNNNITGNFTAGTGGNATNGITFGNTGAVGTSAFTLAGNQITLVAGSGAGGSIISSAVTVGSITDTISLGLILPGTGTFAPGASHNLIISGAISQTGGTRGIIKTGTGELFLQNAGNSFLGTTTINTGTLTVNVAGGIQNSGTNSALGAGTAGANSQINFSGGTLNVTLGAGSTDRQVRVGSTTVGNAAGAIINNNSTNGGTPLVFSNAAFNVSAAGNITATRNLGLGGSNTDANAISGVIIDSATGTGGLVSVTKSGAGKWILSGTNTYTGNTTVSAGTLLINGNQIASTGAVNVSGATSILGGNGTIGGAVAIGANSTLSPGNSPGLLTMNSTLTLSSVDSKLNFEIATGARGTNYDAVNVTGLLTYNGDLTLTIGATIADGTYDLFGGAAAGALSQTGSFDTIAFAGGAYSGSWVNNSGIWTVTSAGQNFTFTQSTGDLVVAVPEPATWGLLTASLTGLMIFRRRRV